jgi:CheY-like chemotaxis protein
MNISPGGGSAIVIVEDEVSIGELVKRAIRHVAPTYDVVLAQHGMGAIIQVEARHVPLVITDYNMPDMSGVEVTREITKRSPTTCVIALTAYADGQLKRQFFAAGARYFLEKPVSLDHLMELVPQLLAAPRADTP